MLLSCLECLKWNQLNVRIVPKTCNITDHPSPNDQPDGQCLGAQPAGYDQLDHPSATPNQDQWSQSAGGCKTSTAAPKQTSSATPHWTCPAPPRHGITTFELNQTKPQFFILSNSFPLAPVAQNKVNQLPRNMLEKSPPDVSKTIPVPAACGSFFVLSSLTPIPFTGAVSGGSKVAPRIKLKTKKKHKHKVNVKKQTKTLSFEKKVLKSKLVNANLQKQRHRNCLRFKNLIKENCGIFTCQLCGSETGYRLQAWSHATRCGMRSKKSKKVVKLQRCLKCNKLFSSKQSLVQHFRAEHQTAKYICALCTIPKSFKFKYSLKRHYALKHTQEGAMKLFECSWCRFSATQKSNLKRHVGRQHKSVKLVSSILDLVVKNVIAEAGLCEYDRIRLRRMREIKEVFDVTFPEEIVLKPRRTIKPRKCVPNPSRRSTRLAAAGCVGVEMNCAERRRAGGVSGVQSDWLLHGDCHLPGDQLAGHDLLAHSAGSQAPGPVQSKCTPWPQSDGGCETIPADSHETSPVPPRAIVVEILEELLGNCLKVENDCEEGCAGEGGELGQDMELGGRFPEHISFKVIQCSLCSFKTSHKHSLKRHIVNKHEPLAVNLPCPRSFCSQTFPTRYEKEIHVPQCYLICSRDECGGKMFIRPDKFQQHLRMHKKMDAKTEE